MSYYGKLTGKHYDSIEAMKHYESIEAQRRNVPTDEQAAFDNLPAEKIRELFNQASLSEQQKAAIAERDVDISVFLELHPEYADCPENGAAMNAVLLGILKARNGHTVRLEDLESAFDVLKDRGALKLDEKVVRKQQQQGIQQRAEALRQQRHFDESEAEGLSLDELRQRASAQLSGVHFTTDSVGAMGAEYGQAAKPLNGASVLDNPQSIVHPGDGLNRRGFAESRRF